MAKKKKDPREENKALKQRLEKLQEAMEGMMSAMVLALEMRDPFTIGHHCRVANLACAIGREMGLSGHVMEGIRLSALIHDLGKIYVPAQVLSKPGQLSEIEFTFIKAHPQIAYDILKNLKFPWPLARIVYQHHERMDGSGYPCGLSGKDILQEARILGAADVVEAMSFKRAFRPALGIEKALEQISLYRDILYDPLVVDACLKVFKKGFKFKPEVELVSLFTGQ